jgi:hypothetical protein
MEMPEHGRNGATSASVDEGSAALKRGSEERVLR